MSEDRGDEGLGPAIVQVARPIGESPQRGGAPLVAAGHALDDPVVERRPHVVQQQIRVEARVIGARVESRRVARRAACLREDGGARRLTADRLGRRKRRDEVRQGGDHGAIDVGIGRLPGAGTRAARRRAPRRQRARQPELVPQRLGDELLERRDVGLPAEPPQLLAPRRAGRRGSGRPLTPVPRWRRACARIVSAGIASISPLPKSCGVFRIDVTFAPAGIPAVRSQSAPSSEIAWACANGPPRPIIASKRAVLQQTDPGHRRETVAPHTADRRLAMAGGCTPPR